MFVLHALHLLLNEDTLYNSNVLPINAIKQ